IPEHKIWLFANAAYQGGKMYVPEHDQEVIVINGIGYQSKHVRVYGGDLPQIDVTGKPSWTMCMR
ncbi:MAG TPA: hypothetical protein PL124_12540, partial [Candidatus Cloacimonadota bacterium]|nr:hypothetical protein [Candidatus Cloacimonadota bacterium]